MKNILTFIFIYSVFLANCFSQIKFDSKGTDFWLTFLPNYHNNIDNLDPEKKYGDSLFLFINAEKPTAGRIEYTDRFGISHSANFSISDPAIMFTFKVSFFDYELWGYNYSGKIWSQYQSDKIAPQSFHITSDNEITVYAHDQAQTTSDAFLVLPTDVLGLEYYVMSYNSDGRLSLDSYSRTPSQFAVLATEDNTTVTIRTKISSFQSPPGTRTIKLNKGNSYLVQAKFDVLETNPDMTGSYITSDKPVAVFGGHQRSTIPVNTSNDNASRDCLLEQIPPVTTWGKNAFVVPPKEPNDPTTITGSLYRVLACQDSTIIKVDGVAKSIINAGEFFEEVLSYPKEIISSKPVLVSVFKYTAGSSGTTFPLGDPFMMIIPPKEQFLRICRVNNIQTWEKNPGDDLYYKVYLEQYITIVAETSGLDSVFLDNKKLSQNDFTEIGNSDFSYIHIPVVDGVHSINSRLPVGVYIYGYGNANSFGYVGGMDFRKINFEPPFISVSDSCFSARGVVLTADSAIKLKDVSFDALFTNNVNVGIGNFLNLTKTSFTVSLLNNRYDGATVIKATDSDNKYSEKLISVPGLTLSSYGPRYSDTIPNFKIVASPTASQKVTIWNYGKFNQTIKSARLKVADVGVLKQYPSVIKSGTSDTLLLEFNVNDDSVHFDTLLAETDCGVVELASFVITRSNCDISAFDFQEFNYNQGLYFNGYAKIINKFVRLTDAERYRTGAFWYSQTVPVLDGFTTDFKFRLTSGNNFQCEDGSLPGADGIAFVIQNAGKSAIGYSGGSIGYEGIYNSLAIEFDTFSNDSTQIEDYHDPNGNHVAVNTNGVRENTSKHLPGVTLGLNENIIQMKTDSTFYYARIQYSLKNKNMIIYLDTVKDPKNVVLSIDNFDIGKYLSLDRGYRAYVGFTSATGCAVENHDIFSWSFCPAHPNPATNTEDDTEFADNHLKVISNPSQSDALIVVDLQSSGFSSISAFDILGNKIEDVYHGYLAEGRHSFVLSTSAMSKGIYFIRLTTENNSQTKKLILTN